MKNGTQGRLTGANEMNLVKKFGFGGGGFIMSGLSIAY